MIQHERRYLEYIQARGVGEKDQVASSPKSYISYLNCVSRLLRKPISPDILHCDEDITRVVNEIQGKKKPGTLRNCKTAMRHYVAMVIDAGLWDSEDERHGKG